MPSRGDVVTHEAGFEPAVDTEPARPPSRSRRDRPAVTAAGRRRTPSADRRGPCDPRVARSRAAVLDATVDLLGEVGHGGTTVEAIAERSGVAKTTIYRHWPSRAPLLIDAFHCRVEHVEATPTGDVRADLWPSPRAWPPSSGTRSGAGSWPP